MRLLTQSCTALLLTGAASVAFGQNIHFNEIYQSHGGGDIGEYIELIGTPGLSLDGIVVAIIDGDSGGANSVLKRVWDLTGLTVPADGYFVLGNASVATADYDLANGPHMGNTQDNIENGSNTFYLLNVPDPLDIADLEGVLYNGPMDTDGDFITAFSTDAAYTIIENIANKGVPFMTSMIVGDIYDCAPFLDADMAGPFTPAGFARLGDYPGLWCGDVYLNFTNGDASQTPGTANPAATTPACGIQIDSGTGCGTMSNVGTPFCNPMDMNSVGLSTTLTGQLNGVAGSGLHLEGTDGPPNQFGYFLVGTAVSDPGMTISNGRLCLATAAPNVVGRYNITTGAGVLNSVGQFDASGRLQNIVGTSVSGSGFDVPAELPFGSSPMIMPGETWNFQLWHREPGGQANFSNGLSYTF